MISTPKPVSGSGASLSLKGMVYHDKNCNYKFDADDSPLSQVTVSIYQFKQGQVYSLAALVTSNDGKYSFTTKANSQEDLILQPGPYKQGYSIVTMSGLPQQVHLSLNSRMATQDLPLIDDGHISICL
jgi:hypothetical protein